LLAVAGTTGIWLYATDAFKLPPQHIAAQEGAIENIAFSPDRSTLAYSHANAVALWNLKTGQRQALPTVSEDAVGGLAFSTDGKHLAATVWHYPPPSECPLEAIHSLQLWDVESGTFIRSYPDHVVPGFRFSADGKRLLIAVAPGCGLWGSAGSLNLETGKATLHSPSYRSTGARILTSAFSKDGSKVAIGGCPLCNAYVDIGKTDIDQSISSLSPSDEEKNSIVESLDFSPDGALIAVGNSIGTVLLWDVATATIKVTLRGLRQVRGATDNVAFSPDGRLLAAANGYDVEVWDVTTRQSLADLSHFAVWPAYLAEHFVYAYSMADYYEMFDMETGQLIRKIPGRPGANQRASLSPDGALAALGSQNNATLWDAYTGNLKKLLDSGPDAYFTPLFSSDGRFLATTDSSSGIVKVWLAASGELYRSLSHDHTVIDWQFSPDGTLLVTLNGDVQKWFDIWSANKPVKSTITIWEIASGRQLTVIKDTYYYRLTFSPDGKTLALYNGGKLSRPPMGNDPGLSSFDISSGKERWHLSLYPTQVQFSRDGHQFLLITPQYNNAEDSLALVNATNGQKTIGFKIPEPQTTAFNLDGSLFAVTDRSGDVFLCGTETGAILFTLPNYHETVWSMFFSPDGTELITAGQDGTIRRWAVTPFF
jgi:WD40 repeat protein